MNSRILNFFNVKLDAFIVFVSVVVVIMFIALFFLLLDYLKMRKRYVEFMTGESGKSLEYTIYKRFREIDKLKAGQKDNDAQIAIIYDMLRRNYSKVGIYKYDAFNVENSLSGGSISFALTLLNSRDNGFILNVINNRRDFVTKTEKRLKGDLNGYQKFRINTYCRRKRSGRV